MQEFMLLFLLYYYSTLRRKIQFSSLIPHLTQNLPTLNQRRADQSASTHFASIFEAKMLAKFSKIPNYRPQQDFRSYYVNCFCTPIIKSTFEVQSEPQIHNQLSKLCDGTGRPQHINDLQRIFNLTFALPLKNFKNTFLGPMLFCKCLIQQPEQWSLHNQDLRAHSHHLIFLT